MSTTSQQPLDDDPFVSVVHVPPRMTEEEFVAWSNEEVRAEWVNGEVILMSPVDVEHCRLRNWLWRVLDEFVRDRRLGEVFGPQMAVRLSRPPQRREPDILFVATEHAAIVGDTLIDGPPDLIVEIVSPESVARDWREKYQAYEAAGVLEYWIVDPHSRQVHVYTLDAQGHYGRVPEMDGKVQSTAVRGFWLKAEWLWPETRPDAREVMRALNANEGQSS